MKFVITFINETILLNTIVSKIEEIKVEQMESDSIVSAKLIRSL